MPRRIEMDPDLAEGDGRCEMPDGSEVKIRIPQQTPPKGTIKVQLSPEDFGSLLAVTKDAPRS